MFNQGINEYLKTISEDNDPKPDLAELPRLLIIGGMWDNWQLFESSEWNGIIADDLSFSGRDINYTLPESNSLIDYCKAQMLRIPEPTTYDMHKRLDNIEELIKRIENKEGFSSMLPTRVERGVEIDCRKHHEKPCKNHR